ncbi:hypothetical protein L6452_22259 [Arctium lappa]|uniref:Uncharacterized protein n=1 Tax=Arctium lappa TaxID=4217 RepID=A0ACB9B080_ARCLA|nr:hypothetical protein L6452_22259 [Arctium lappa]
MWSTLCSLYEGTDEVKKSKKIGLVRKYELFSYEKGESLSDYYNRFNGLLNDLKLLYMTMRKSCSRRIHHPLEAYFSDADDECEKTSIDQLSNGMAMLAGNEIEMDTSNVCLMEKINDMEDLEGHVFSTALVSAECSSSSSQIYIDCSSHAHAFSSLAFPSFCDSSYPDSEDSYSMNSSDLSEALKFGFWTSTNLYKSDTTEEIIKFIKKFEVLNSQLVRPVKKNFDPKADEGIFVGYSLSSKAYQVYNLWGKCIDESVHMKFDDHKSSSVSCNDDE